MMTEYDDFRPKKERHFCLPYLIPILLILLMLLPVSTVSAKVRLNKTQIRLYVGDQTVLTVKGAKKKKVTWSISGKKAVRITPKGAKKQTAVIRAKKAGSCYVEAKVGRKKLRCRIIVKKKASGGEDEPVIPVTPTEVTDPVLLGIANASVRLFQEAIAEESDQKNILLSPYSVLTAVALMENGAAGATRQEMESFLGGQSTAAVSQVLSTMSQRLSSEKVMTFQTANAVWYRKGKLQLRPSYEETVKTRFGAEIVEDVFDGSTVQKINAWVSEKTKGRIQKILDSLSSSINAVLLNAVYFKGDWREPYTDTVSRVFTDASGKETKTSMLEGNESTYITLKGAEGFIKPYLGKNVVFLGLLPQAGQTVEQFMKSITGKDLVIAYANRQTSGVTVHTRMPEFTCEYELSLDTVLQKLGIRTAFSDMADFSQMTASELKIDRALHKTWIRLDKNGTEAAAVTAVVMATSSIQLDRKEKWVYLDRPFVYALLDADTGLPLFIGTVRTVS